jgi:hypothetical protein
MVHHRNLPVIMWANRRLHGVDKRRKILVEKLIVALSCWWLVCGTTVQQRTLSNSSFVFTQVLCPILAYTENQVTCCSDTGGSITVSAGGLVCTAACVSSSSVGCFVWRVAWQRCCTQYYDENSGSVVISKEVRAYLAY